MKRVINGKMYNTDTAEEVAAWDNGIYGRDFRTCEKRLFLTKKGQYFVAGSGGPMSEYAERCGSSTGGGSGIELLHSKKAAAKWCEDLGLTDVLEDHFSDCIEEG